MTNERAKKPEDGSEESAQMQAHLRVLGLAPGATWADITAAHRRLVSDLTPGPDASHANVGLAEDLLDEVNKAYASLQRLVAVA